jgi:hypothetical protein
MTRPQISPQAWFCLRHGASRLLVPDQQKLNQNQSMRKKMSRSCCWWSLNRCRQQIPEKPLQLGPASLLAISHANLNKFICATNQANNQHFKTQAIKKVRADQDVVII